MASVGIVENQDRRLTLERSAEGRLIRGAMVSALAIIALTGPPTFATHGGGFIFDLIKVACLLASTLFVILLFVGPGSSTATSLLLRGGASLAEALRELERLWSGESRRLLVRQWLLRALEVVSVVSLVLGLAGCVAIALDGSGRGAANSFGYGFTGFLSLLVIRLVIGTLLVAADLRSQQRDLALALLGRLAAGLGGDRPVTLSLELCDALSPWRLAAWDRSRLEGAGPWLECEAGLEEGAQLEVSLAQRSPGPASRTPSGSSAHGLACVVEEAVVALRLDPTRLAGVEIDQPSLAEELRREGRQLSVELLAEGGLRCLIRSAVVEVSWTSRAIDRDERGAFLSGEELLLIIEALARSVSSAGGYRDREQLCLLPERASGGRSPS